MRRPKGGRGKVFHIRLQFHGSFLQLYHCTSLSEKYPIFFHVSHQHYERNRRRKNGQGGRGVSYPISNLPPFLFNYNIREWNLPAPDLAILTPRSLSANGFIPNHYHCIHTPQSELFRFFGFLLFWQFGFCTVKRTGGLKCWLGGLGCRLG